MAIRTKKIKNSNGITYTKELDSSLDYSGITNDTYFKNLSDGLIYWKNTLGNVIPIFNIADGNFYTTGGTVVNQTIVYDRNDTLSAYTIDVSGLIPDVDYGNVIYVSEVGPTGDTRSDVVGNPLKPVGLEWASQIAQSGDTIHVESGIYNLTISGATNSLTVDGVNHYFKQGAKVYKTTSGSIFRKDILGGPLTSGGNVFGLGSFYGSDLCGVIFYDTASDLTFFEFEDCTNTTNGCYVSLFNELLYIRGKNEISSISGVTISHGGSGSNTSLYIDCPIIKSTTNKAITLLAGGGSFKHMTVNAITIENLSGDIAVDVGSSTGSVIINANFINYVQAINPGGPLNINLNVKKINKVNYSGSLLNCTGHIMEYTHSAGIADIHLCDKINATNIGNITTILNGATGNTVSEISGAASVNLKLARADGSLNSFSEKRTINIGFGTANVNLIGNWNCDNLAINMSGGTLNIPNNTTIDIGPSSTGTTFFNQGGRINLSGKIIQTTTEPSHKIMDFFTGTMVYNGATIIVSSEDKQIITTDFFSSPVKIYTGGLNTNKLNSFSAEQEKRKVNVTGTGATITISGQTFVSTTGTTNAQIAVELTSLINASPILITASQDTPGTDTYFYIEADIAGTAMTIVYNLNTSLNSIIRYNNKGVYDIVGGPKIEDADID